MTDDERFSLATARQAAEEGRLADWVEAFLASPGSDNAELGASLAFAGTSFHGPVCFELEKLTPMAGPDEDEVVVPISEEEWESDVEAMKESVAQGWEPPPLLVSHRDGGYFLEDGNHRYETLRRSGATDAWAILVFSDDAERDRFLAEGDGEAPARGGGAEVGTPAHHGEG